MNILLMIIGNYFYCHSSWTPTVTIGADSAKLRKKMPSDIVFTKGLYNFCDMPNTKKYKVCVFQEDTQSSSISGCKYSAVQGEDPHTHILYISAVLTWRTG